MDKAFTVSLCNPDKDVYVTLAVPAEPWAVLDTWERLRLAPDTRVEWEIEDYGEFPELFPALASGEDFPALNTLAERLAGLDERQRAAFEGLVRLQDGRPMEPGALTALAEQARHCHVVPEATDDAQLGRFYAGNGFLTELDGLPDRVFELLDFQLLGRRIRAAEGGIFTRHGFVVPDGSWKPAQSQEARVAPETPAGIFRLELQLGEEQAVLTLPAGQELAEVRDRMDAVGLSNCAVTAFRSRIPQLPAAWAIPERLDTLNCLAIRLTVLEDREPLKLVKYKAVLEVSPPSSLEEAMALTERLDAYIRADRHGVRIAKLTEESYRRLLWAHRPLTDFWRVGKGYAGKLEANGLYTMGDIARCSIGKTTDYHNEELLYKLFGVNAEILIDHAWGWEPCTIADVKAYKPENKSIVSGQVLQCPYGFDKARLVVREMADALALELVDKRLVTNQLVLTVGYDRENLDDPRRRQSYHGPVTTDRYGRSIPKHAVGTENFPYTSSANDLQKAAAALYDRIVDKNLLVRRLSISANKLLDEGSAPKGHEAEQLDLFTDYAAREQQERADEAAHARERKLQEAMLGIKKRYGKNAILKGMNLEDGATAKERNQTIGGHQA